MKKIDDIGINLAKENIKILEKDKKILDALKYQDIVSLDPANSSKVMRILMKYPTKNPDIAAIIKLL